MAKASGVLCDIWIATKLKEKLYMIGIRPDTLYQFEYWAVKKHSTQKE